MENTFFSSVIAAIISSHVSFLYDASQEKYKKKDSTVVTAYDMLIQRIFVNSLQDCGLEVVAEEDDALLDSLMDKSPCSEDAAVRSVISYAKENGFLELLKKPRRQAFASEKGLSSFITVDPIDGTRGFVGGGFYSIALGCVVDKKVAFSVVSSPKKRKVFYTFDSALEYREEDFVDRVNKVLGTEIACAESIASYKLRINGEKRVLEAALGQTIGESIREFADAFFSIKVAISAFVDHLSPILRRFVEDLSRRYRISLHRVDGQDKYLGVASREYDLFIRLPCRGYREKIWDHLPGREMVVRAGGLVTDVYGNDLDVLNGMEQSYGVVASMSEHLQVKVLELVRELLDQERDKKTRGQGAD